MIEGEDLENRAWPQEMPELPEVVSLPGRWVDAACLRGGDLLSLVNGKQVPVESVTSIPCAEKVFNLEVAEINTYAVGRIGVLVHNNEGICPGSGGSGPHSTPSLREQYLGRTPGKSSRTGRQVIERMETEGNLRWNSNGGAEVRYFDPVTKAESWHPLNSTDMGHLNDAVKYWNETGRTLGPKHPDVRKWMIDPANYELQPSSINRSNGARLKDRNMPPVGDD